MPRHVHGVVLVLVVSFVALAACVGSDPTPAGPSSSAADGGTTGTKGLGARCSAGETCAEGACVDGYCCDKPCSGVCESCSVEGHLGQCTPVTGKPLHGSCQGDTSGPCAGSCDGTNAEACTYPEAACGAGSCAGGTATLPSTCKAGSCPAATTQTCALGCFGDACLGVKQVAAGYYFACAVLTDKKVRCWGKNDNGQLRLGIADPGDTVQTTPIEVKGIANAVGIAATFGAACALLDDGTVKCWGSNVTGELGTTADQTRHPTPTTVAGVSGATFLGGSSGGHFCAIVGNGQIRCWGSNDSGQIGNGAKGATSAPSTVCAPGSTQGASCSPATGASFVVGGDTHTCAILAGGSVACWGGNDYKQLGSASLPDPEPLPRTIPNLTATYLTAGNRITCAASAGGAKCWGANSGGLLGDGKDDTAQATPVDVCAKQDCSALLQNVTGLSTADESACALAGGAVSCWGGNSRGQLGDGNEATAKQNFAASKAIASGAVAVASGGGTNFAIVVDGANRNVRCWGDDSTGQCGDGAPAGTSFQKVPVSPKW